MKVTLKELRGAIQLIIREEMTKILPGMLAEALADKYMTKMMAEVTRSAGAKPHVHTRPAPVKKPNSLQELMSGDAEADTDWEEEVPKAMDNEHRGIYHQSPLVRGKSSAQNEARDPAARRRALAQVYGDDPEAALEDPRFRQQEAVERIAQGNPELAMMFEGTRPAAPMAGGGSVTLGESQQQFGEEGVPLDFLGKIGVNFNAVKRNVEGNSPPAAKEQVDDAALKMLERRRAALNVRAE